MIRKLNVRGMNHRFNYILEFGEGINILTGLNGSGKTTLLKLIWYLTSGNLHRIIPEIPLTFVEIETTWFTLSIEPRDTKFELTWKFGDKQRETRTVALDKNSLAKNLDALNKQIAEAVPGSLFFPTFRRPEGNYAAEPKMEVLQKALLEFSDELSVKVAGANRHKFIAAVSTTDIGKLLKQKYDRLSELEDESEERKELQGRFLQLRTLVKHIYVKYGKINIPKSISFEGEHPGNPGISSENLSAGEKEFLGFICYNAFSEEAVIFIDEPESSLHIDYERTILQFLSVQGTQKQFLIATHSPFIFSKYPEAEINLEEKTDEPTTE